jgi:hypothetical protein
MNAYSLKRFPIVFFGLSLFISAALSYAGRGYYYVEPLHWGYHKDDYGPPKPGYGYLAPLTKEVQVSLNARGYDPGPIDGSWGEKTSQALKQYQQDMGLPVTGWIDLKTADLLFGGIKMHFNLTKQVQRALAKQGYPPGPIDGLWGDRTKDALMNFQRDQGLYPSGLVDPKLLNLLLENKANE